MPDNRQWYDENYHGAAGRWPMCPPCPPCPPCRGPVQPGPPRPQPPRPQPPRPQPPRTECPPGSGRFCGWRGSNLSASEAGQIREMQQETEEDLYMADEMEKEWMEQDWLYMKQRYPNIVRKMQRYVDDALDKLEYENSMMFDEYPDDVAIMQLVQEIIAAIQENEPQLLSEEILMEPVQGQPANDQQENTGSTDNNTWPRCAEMLVYVMVLAEMHHRRWRYFQMRRRFY